MAPSMIVACIGAGRMGRGIAHAAAYAGYDIRLLDAKERDTEAFARLRAEALAEVRDTLTTMADLGAFDRQHVDAILKRVTIEPIAQADAVLRDAGIIFEAVPEVLEAKKHAFALFDRHAANDAILASTTSTMLSTELAGLSKAPERFLNTHWLNPAFLIPLIEVSPTPATRAEVLRSVDAFLESLGKVPVHCQASPGYIVPRIQALAMNEAARLVEEGVASAEDVDKAIKYGFGLRFAVLGLLEFIDWGGGDILYYASRYMAGAMQDDRFAAPDIIQANMRDNRIGLRTGQGFFDYQTMDVARYRQERLAAFLKMLNDNQLMRGPVL